MPIYLYETVPCPDSEPEHFEIEQPETEPPLTHHPETSEPIRRIRIGNEFLTKRTAPADQGCCGPEGCC